MCNLCPGDLLRRLSIAIAQSTNILTDLGKLVGVYANFDINIIDLCLYPGGSPSSNFCCDKLLTGHNEQDVSLLVAQFSYNLLAGHGTV